MSNLKKSQKSKKLKSINVKTADEASLLSTISSTESLKNVIPVNLENSKRKKTPNHRHWLTNKLRRLSYQWPPRKQAIVNARVERGVYKCASCEGLFGPKEIQLDHKIPVVDEEIGFIDFNTYIERLFCDVDNFQVLCKPCHEAKTFFEQEIRKQVKREKNNKDEDI